MPSLLTLLLFCDFLENRLHTSNLALLRRILSDFFAGNERTLQDFVRLGASVVAVMPVERASRRCQREAARLLAQQRQMAGDDPRTHQLCVFRYLSARVATRNILRLRDMFQQFCSGSDALLQDFVGRGNEVISLIPADIQATSMSSAARARHPAELASQMPLRSTLDQSPGELERDLDSESEDEEDIDEDDDEIKTIVELASVASVPPSLDELRVCIIDVLQRVEEREPWYQVFNPDRLPLPFSVVKRPLLAAALKDFWAKNARAVWERQFWAPLVNMEDQRIYRARKQRQSKARAAFERVMIRVHTELGANFFVQLDQRAKPHKGWWYVEPVQDLVQLAQREGLAACLCYVESQALERFPVVPGGDVRNAKTENSKSKSMWTVKCAMQPILEEVCAIKAKNKHLGRRKQK